MFMINNFNSKESKKEKKPNVYQNFTYDNETDGGCISKLSELSKITIRISNDIEEIGKRYSKLQKIYNKFTGFNDKMELNKNSLRKSIDNTKKEFEQIMEDVKTIIVNSQEKDSTLIDDLKAINKLISDNKDLNETLDKGRDYNDKFNPTKNSDNEAGFRSSAGNKIKGKISPGSLETTYAAKPYKIDKNSEEYKQLVATVYAEASELPDYIESDTMGVVSTILNRVDSDRYPDNILDVISAKGQFDGYNADNIKHKKAYDNINVVPQEMLNLIDRVLAGERNVKGYNFIGDGTKTHFND